MQHVFLITFFFTISSVTAFFFGSGGGCCQQRPSCGCQQISQNPCCRQQFEQIPENREFSRSNLNTVSFSNSGYAAAPSNVIDVVPNNGYAVASSNVIRPASNSGFAVSSSNGYVSQQNSRFPERVNTNHLSQNIGYEAEVQPQQNGQYLIGSHKVNERFLTGPQSNAVYAGEQHSGGYDVGLQQHKNKYLAGSLTKEELQKNNIYSKANFIDNFPKNHEETLVRKEILNFQPTLDHNSENVPQTLRKDENLSEYKNEKFKARAAKTVFVETRCNSEDLKQVLEENIVINNANESKKQVYNAANILFTNSNEKSSKRIDVICAPNAFSYRIATEFFCEHTKEDITCFAYQQNSN